MIKVADNFDYNPDGVYGNIGNIHILNQILVMNPDNDEIPNIVETIVKKLVDDVAYFTDQLSSTTNESTSKNGVSF